MAWRDVLKLLEVAGGDLEAVEPAALKRATAGGRGAPEIQIRIARHLYKTKYERSHDNGQTRWEFG